MSSGFITESEVLEIRKRRQEEWEKVRQPNDALERPEEPYDNRSLFDKLQEQKQKKDLEYEEAHKLKNMIKGLDDDEIEFLDLVDRTKSEVNRKKEVEEEQELLDYRNRVSTLQEKYMNDMYHSNIIINQTKCNRQQNPQKKSLKGIVIKKNENLKRKGIISETTEEPDRKKTAANTIGDKTNTEINKEAPITILPGIGCYKDSSSENEDSVDNDDTLLQKKVKKVESTEKLN
ncbi:PSME3-interacting protein isoform X1 [Diorhabda sublineata]|uniref:PSME3-interacting protein isoform X1 n=1 Tax=Diorhabda sublineata TaxID=1163346 RepID=UPI0024E0B0F8|nr:PSME3-interacting protein isoform X1 [Diorhabda sublineata]